MNETHENEGRGRRWLRVGVVATAAAVVLAIGGAMVLPLGEATAGFFRRPHGDHSPEEMRERAGLMVSWVLSTVDATDEQQARVSAILDRTMVTLAPLHAGREADRAALVAALTGPSVDRTTLEELRAEKVAEMTVASEELLLSIADVADVLTQEQRIELAEMAERFHH